MDMTRILEIKCERTWKMKSHRGYLGLGVYANKGLVGGPSKLEPLWLYRKYIRIKGKKDCQPI